MASTGVDITPAFLSEAVKRSQNERVKMEWIEGNILDYTRPDYYDAVINLYTSFGYFKDPNDKCCITSSLRSNLAARF